MSRCFCCGKEFKVGDNVMEYEFEHGTMKFCENPRCEIQAMMINIVLTQIAFPDERLKKKIEEGLETMTSEEIAAFLDNLKNASQELREELLK